MVPRALFDIFTSDLSDLNVSISFAEIYNEKIFDLLQEPKEMTGQGKRPHVSV